MIYRCALINRRPGLDQAAFRRHWIEVHGALASRLPGVGSYRQNHIAERLFESDDSPLQAIDGIAQLSFDSVAAMERSDASAEYAAVKLDIPKFQGGITILVIEADEIVSCRGPAPVKLLWISSRREGVAATGLRERWLAAHRGVDLLLWQRRDVQPDRLYPGEPGDGQAMEPERDVRARAAELGLGLRSPPHRGWV